MKNESGFEINLCKMVWLSICQHFWLPVWIIYPFHHILFNRLSYSNSTVSVFKRHAQVHRNWSDLLVSKNATWAFK